VLGDMFASPPGTPAPAGGRPSSSPPRTPRMQTGGSPSGDGSSESQPLSSPSRRAVLEAPVPSGPTSAPSESTLHAMLLETTSRSLDVAQGSTRSTQQLAASTSNACNHRSLSTRTSRSTCACSPSAWPRCPRRVPLPPRPRPRPHLASSRARFRLTRTLVPQDTNHESTKQMQTKQMLLFVVTLIGIIAYVLVQPRGLQACAAPAQLAALAAARAPAASPACAPPCVGRPRETSFDVEVQRGSGLALI